MFIRRVRHESTGKFGMTLCVASSGRFFMSRIVRPFSVRPVKWNRPVPVNANRPDRPDFASSTGHRQKNGYRKIPCKKTDKWHGIRGRVQTFRRFSASCRYPFHGRLPRFRSCSGHCMAVGQKVWIPIPSPSGFCAFSFRRMVFPFLSGIGPSPFCHGHSSAFRPEIAAVKRKCLKKAI